MKSIKEGNKKYMIDKKRDLVIFNKIKKLEKNKLKFNDRRVIKLMKTQLEGNGENILLIT